MANANSLITIDPETLGGIPVFSGTRVPVKTLIEYLEAGDRLDEGECSSPTLEGQTCFIVTLTFRHFLPPQSTTLVAVDDSANRVRSNR